MAALVRRVALLGVLSTVALSARANETEQDPFPRLPERAGRIDSDAPKTFTKTPSGLTYRILRSGKGRRPKAGDHVVFDYHGWLDSGKVFDSTYDRRAPYSLALDKCIKGLAEGIQVVDEGGMIELEIPPDLAYGDKSVDRIPRDATLHFLVELISATQKDGDAGF